MTKGKVLIIVGDDMETVDTLYLLIVSSMGIIDRSGRAFAVPQFGQGR
jgi:hypothetical protein